MLTPCQWTLDNGDIQNENVYSSVVIYEIIWDHTSCICAIFFYSLDNPNIHTYTYKTR